jgi:hypothetical protein
MGGGGKIGMETDGTWVLVEGPAWGDAQFYGEWLLAAAQAQVLWRTALEDQEFATQVERLRVDGYKLFKIDGKWRAFLVKPARWHKARGRQRAGSSNQPPPARERTEMSDDSRDQLLFTAAQEFSFIGYLARHRDGKADGMSDTDLSALAKAFELWDRVEAALIDLLTHEIRNPRLDPRCGARTRAGTACQRPAIHGRRRCRLHGGLSPGAPRGAKNGNFRHGNWTTEAVEERRWLRSLVQAFAKAGSIE